jgi:hypothetical protein
VLLQLPKYEWWDRDGSDLVALRVPFVQVTPDIDDGVDDDEFCS